jgi:carbamoyl-phosphate synthase large subunit
VSTAGRLCLESTEVFQGTLLGAPVDDLAWGEIVFNTCMTGYEEILSDPSYAGQIVVMTYPMIGNYGSHRAHRESFKYHCRALVVRELCLRAGHGAADYDLETALAEQGVPVLAGVDTRRLTRAIRNQGAVRATIAPVERLSIEEQVPRTRSAPSISEQDLVAETSQTEPVLEWTESLPEELHPRAMATGAGLTIVCLDLGIKRNQLRSLVSRGARVIVVRHDASIEDILRHNPDGVLISNGPGDPARLSGQVAVVRDLVERRVPTLGICLGHQILGQAVGATTSKLRFGHHGGNHPVKDVRSGRVFITAQNHEFQVVPASIPESEGWYCSEINLNDESVEALRHESIPAFSVQYHPEGAPGPQDRADVFDEFLAMCRAPGPVTLSAPAVRRKADLKSVLVIGSGPVIIGQAAEFDYAGTQACRSLREEGVRVVLVNSNPATIMTDDASADAVYIEPLTVPVLEKIIARERPDGVLATLGGQTALNLAVDLGEAGVLEKYGVRVLGTSLEAIQIAEDRERFKRKLQEIGEPVPESRTVQTLNGAREFMDEIGLPLVVRPAFTLGGTGGGLCETEDIFVATVVNGLAASPIGQVLIEKSIAGWREIEYEVMRDGAGTTITICNMENIDPMGVHTGDSIVVAPSQTLTDREHQRLRTAALRIIEELGIEGGCNVQFALAPSDHRYFVIEVNPRVSRSSALASKATGYPIARVAAKVALGKRLDEIPNAVTGKTSSAFEPAIDYCVVKIPRWPFDKFPTGDRRLGTQMKSTGEVMAIERTFAAALSKALRSLEQPLPTATELEEPVLLTTPNDRRLPAILAALRTGASPESIAERSKIGAWFIRAMAELIDVEGKLATDTMTAELLRVAKQHGLSDERIIELSGLSEETIAETRRAHQVVPTYKCVDTCAAEFEAVTPYYYSTFEEEDEVSAGAANEAVVVVGSGPIRIGQGIEFDYCSVQAALALRADSVPAIMINSNPETVSTDFDCSTRLYFEPLDAEAVSSVINREAARGVVVQFGGQTAINLAEPLGKRGHHILGTDIDSIDLAEDRSRWEAFLNGMGISQPPGAATLDRLEAVEIASRLGYPVLVRPSFVLGGRGMEIIYSRQELETYVDAALRALPMHHGRRRGSLLVDKYLIGTEVDVDLISDGDTVVIPGLMQHIERAGVHSGDSMAIYPPVTLEPAIETQIEEHAIRIARALQVRGLCNIQFVAHRGKAYVIEVNPRASRTVPFISKVTGVPMVDLATRVGLGAKLATLGWSTGIVAAPPLYAVKAPVFSTAKLDNVDSSLGPEMKSTGEVMGVDPDWVAAVEKAFVASLGKVPMPGGGVLCSLADIDKDQALPLMRRLRDLNFQMYGTAGTAAFLQRAGIDVQAAGRIGEARPSVIDIIDEGRVDLVINTVSRADGLTESTARIIRDGYQIRRAADRRRIPCCTSLDTAEALTTAIERDNGRSDFGVATVREYREARPQAAPARPARSSLGLGASC